MARTIDAERLSNELKAYRQQYFGYGWHNEYAVLGQCLSLIDAQPTLTPPNEWVSVKDAMPPELKIVLVYCDGLYDVAGWVKNEDGEVCWTCKTSPNFWRQIPEME